MAPGRALCYSLSQVYKCGGGSSCCTVCENNSCDQNSVFYSWLVGEKGFNDRPSCVTYPDSFPWLDSIAICFYN